MTDVAETVADYIFLKAAKTTKIVHKSRVFNRVQDRIAQAGTRLSSAFLTPASAYPSDGPGSV